MKETQKINIISAIAFIIAGILFLLPAIISKTNIVITWQIVFFIIGLLFFIPQVVFPVARTGLAALYIPGCLFFALGIMFLYADIYNDWNSLAYAWLLIPAFVGLGLGLAAWAGDWGKIINKIGLWIFFGTMVIFSIFGAIFGSAALSFVGPIMIIILGLYIAINSFRKK